MIANERDGGEKWNLIDNLSTSDTVTITITTIATTASPVLPQFGQQTLTCVHPLAPARHVMMMITYVSLHCGDVHLRMVVDAITSCFWPTTETITTITTSNDSSTSVHFALTWLLLLVLFQAAVL